MLAYGSNVLNNNMSQKYILRRFWGFWCNSHVKAAEMVTSPGSPWPPVAGKSLLEPAELTTWPAARRLASLLLLQPAIPTLRCITACKDTVHLVPAVREALLLKSMRIQLCDVFLSILGRRFWTRMCVCANQSNS
jgi:hypothetical protein